MTSRRWSAAFLPPAGDEEAAAPLSERGWRTTVAGMHLISAAMWGLAVVATLLGQNDVGGTDRVFALAALGGLAAAYVLLGVPALLRGRPVHAVGYLGALVAGFGVLGWVAPSLLFLLFLAYPQVWFVVQGRPAGVVWTVLLAGATTLGPLLRPDSGENAGEVVLETGVSLVFSLALGLWIGRVLAQSEQRAELIEQLRSTRAELAAAERERGVLAERERLAREVHDTLAQGYTSIVVLAQTAAGQLDGDVDGARERLALIEEVARDNLQEARAVVAAFGPVHLDGSTLVEALQRLADRFGRETGTAVRVDTSALGEGLALRRDEEVVLLRGAQEALTNVRRHAGASAVVIRLAAVGRLGDRQVSVHVEDDGVGFDPDTTPASGLDGLRDRAGQVGGALEVASVPGAGTRVTVRVPGA
ncbi:sensor histidine kinase [Blastococcus sp. TF02A-30]|uniref:sensor histidine kinase n=1 Tax=Blastococcus sp. TF02A-30 TaxID=2250580 RepID=UPI001F22E9DB|nr:sensor histidine kinase [Blastococcus sp. TF02A-30]